MKMNRVEVEKKYINMVWLVVFSYVLYVSCLLDFFIVFILINCILIILVF